jgi:hypothetical protein
VVLPASLDTFREHALQLDGTPNEPIVLAHALVAHESVIVLLATREYWYSPQLGVNLVSTRDDPQAGKQEFRVTEIVLGAPNPSLFEPPRDAKILDLRNPPESPAGSSTTN